MKEYIFSYDIFFQTERKSKNGKIIKKGMDIQKVKDVGINLFVLDECQQIKNPDASWTQEVR
jgi:hypothetical protein